MKAKVFTWKEEFPLAFMRIEPLGKLYAFSQLDGDTMVFKVVPHGGYRGSGAMLKSLRGQRGWTQAQAGNELGISQSMVSKYEQRKKTIENWVIRTVEVLKQGAVDHNWSLPPKECRVPVFRLTNGTHIACMRIQAMGKLYAYHYHKDDVMYFKERASTPDGTSSRLGTDLKELRKELGWTQAEVGLFLGVKQSAIAKYESGIRVLEGLPLEKFRILKRSGGTVAGLRKFLEYEKSRNRSSSSPDLGTEGLEKAKL